MSLLTGSLGGEGGSKVRSDISSLSPSAEPLRVLFVGNSYTFYNDMPETFAELLRAGGQGAEVGVAAEHGATLEGHLAAAGTLEKLEAGGWDYVILQEQSVMPSQPEERRSHMYPAVRRLHTRAEAMGAKTVLFMTWARRFGFPQVGYEDFAAMQAEVAAGYRELGAALDIPVVPVGLAWQRAMVEKPDLNLYMDDESHPNGKGSYLTACVFYARITEESPLGLPHPASLSEETACLLQRVAAETVSSYAGACYAGA